MKTRTRTAITLDVPDWNPPDLSRRHRERIRRVRAELRRMGSAVLVVGSRPDAIRARSTEYPYRQDSDFFYLTGSRSPDFVLVVSSDLPAPVLLTESVGTVRALYHGSIELVDERAESLGATPRVVDSLPAATLELVRGHDTLFHQNVPGTVSRSIAAQVLDTPSINRRGLPRKLVHTDVILERMRLIKDSDEVKLIERAAAISAAALRAALPAVRPGVNEFQVAEIVSAYVRLHGCELAFDPIVASGAAASVLHYRSKRRRIAPGELVLFDWGAELECYAADLTRTLPADGVFTPLQRRLYTAVLDANRAAIGRIRGNRTVGAAYLAAAEIITEVLVELKVLKGKLSKLVADRAFAPYFGYALGHPLGLDVHDLGFRRGDYDVLLEPGMVFTVEPGIYFQRPVGKIPVLGIRVEEDVLVTDTGCRKLTEGFPVDVDHIEDLMAESRQAGNYVVEGSRNRAASKQGE